MIRCAILCLCCLLGKLPELAAAERSFPLLSPLTTLLPAEGRLPTRADTVVAEITVPEGAPRDLGAGCYLLDDTGRWFHVTLPAPLQPGRQRLRFRIDAAAPLRNEPGGPAWLAHQRTRSSLFGVYLWSAKPAEVAIIVHGISTLSHARTTRRTARPALLDLRGDGLIDNRFSGRCGERWELRCRPQPLPANAYDHDDFILRLIATRPDGSEIAVEAFYRQPLALIDRGDVEEQRATAPGEMVMRLRPDRPGTWRLRIEARWPDRRLETALPDLQVAGEAWSDYIRVDEEDPRFFNQGTGERFYWPVGINLRSITDERSRASELATAPTPNRGIHSYRAYLERLGRAGCELVEVWMSDWNLGLEGMPSTAGFHGVGNYHEANAERLDRLLDIAYEQGMRVLLVINHHGQASERVDAEWQLNPYNQVNQGPLFSARDIFVNPMAREGQDQLRRYLVARYADHPAIFAWKLWTEIDLTAQGWVTRQNNRRNEGLIAWHAQASDRWHDLDPYDHPVTTHWSTNYTYVDEEIAELDSIDLLCIDAYHGFGRRDFTLPELLVESTQNGHRGLARYDKPALATEYGGHPNAGPPGQILAEHSYAPWVAMTSGHGGAPLLWWYEWVDQNDHFWPYRAINRYLAGEDLRHPTARSVALPVAGDRVWARAWARPGLILGYLLDQRWATHVPRRSGKGWSAMPTPRIDGLRMHISSSARPGDIELEWWDPTRGELLHRQRWHHPGDELSLPVPPFRRHLAFKLRRLD